MKKLCIMIMFALIGGASACKKDTNSEGKAKNLSVSSFYPNSGKARTLVTLTGSGFSKDYEQNKITFNGVNARVFSVTDSTLVVSAPDEGATGKLAISVGGTDIDAGTFTYQDLSLSSVSPVRVTAFDVVTINGYGFRGNAAMPKVQIDGADAKITFISDSTLQVSIPTEMKSNGAIRVIVGDKSVSGPQMTVVKIFDYSPKVAFGGGELKITGNGLNPDISGNYVFYKTSERKWGYDENGLWRPKTYYYNDTLKITRSSSNELVAKLPESARILSGTIEIESKGIKKHLKSTETPSFTFLVPPTINQIWQPGSVIYIMGSGLETKLEGMKTHLFVGDFEIPAEYMSIGNTTIVIERKPPGLKSGIIKVIANGKTVLGPTLEL